MHSRSHRLFRVPRRLRDTTEGYGDENETDGISTSFPELSHEPWERDGPWERICQLWYRLKYVPSSRPKYLSPEPKCKQTVSLPRQTEKRCPNGHAQTTCTFN